MILRATKNLFFHYEMFHFIVVYENLCNYKTFFFKQNYHPDNDNNDRLNDDDNITQKYLNLFF